ncbi:MULTISPECIES: ABC transporter ATP-binding protein [unclassified Beijerinckia]|uniref:ABC transporter ATP-binding protein n=1 Tax=unclassified Beijerinckia TaxID=2638183 RepID=UPI000899D9C6|nr:MULTISPECIES: ABC transporter ATP-binding protein [unclassified Beijerinckia]MDH7798889.1 branched-chain amino acid transport system ATP-binding protein [Beijerinckia sp. GAS462]SED87910.1 amino acid/amide ABC transporter ATP-binding protein 2, HAAT family [Beijerinckia sp. 28-YEA-48]
MEPLITIDDVHTYYGDSYVLQGISLQVNPGEVLAVLGRNGVGKTTLVRSIIGFVPPRRGSIRFAGQEIAGRVPETISRAGVALVPQGRRTFRSLSVAETLDVASGLRRFDKHELAWTPECVYAAFPRLKERRDTRAGSLSGGEQQMLAVGRALVGHPRLVLLDEPTEGLSPLLVRELQTVLKDVKRSGSALLLIEQRLNFALSLADRVVIVSKGRVIHETTPEALQADDETRHRYLGV